VDAGAWGRARYFQLRKYRPDWHLNGLKVTRTDSWEDGSWIDGIGCSALDWCGSEQEPGGDLCKHGFNEWRDIFWLWTYDFLPPQGVCFLYVLMMITTVTFVTDCVCS
jgi:hypothetical protein